MDKLFAFCRTFFCDEIGQNTELILIVLWGVLWNIKNVEKKLLVLLVEDEPIVQKVHISILKKLGCEVDLAVNAEEVLLKAQNDYDLIFMDVGLPGDKSGIDVTREIRTKALGRKDIPIIVLTGYSDEAIKNKCLAAQANAVYTKPIGLEALSKILQEYININ